MHIGKTSKRELGSLHQHIVLLVRAVPSQGQDLKLKKLVRKKKFNCHRTAKKRIRKKKMSTQKIPFLLSEILIQ